MEELPEVPQWLKHKYSEIRVSVLCCRVKSRLERSPSPEGKEVTSALCGEQGSTTELLGEGSIDQSVIVKHGWPQQP